VLNPGAPAERALPPKVWGYPLDPGDRVAIETPGAGGYGEPAERAPADRARDERDSVTASRAPVSAAG
jgi:N-methylhydantoinase B